MDRAEKVGLGTAVAGHALLLALLVFGVLQATKPVGSDGGGGGGDGVAVELVSESAPSAPTAAEAEAEEMPVVQEQPEIIPEPIMSPLPTPKPVQKTLPKPAVPKKAVTRPTKPGPPTKGGSSSSYKKRMEEAMRGIAGTGKGSRTNGPGSSTKSAGQVTSEVEISLRNEVKPHWDKCRSRLRGLDIELILTTLALSIAPDGRLTSASFVRQSGVNDSNRPQAALHRECALNAVRAASPFNSLPKDNYSVWKRWEMDFKRNVS